MPTSSLSENTVVIIGSGEGLTEIVQELLRRNATVFVGISSSDAASEECKDIKSDSLKTIDIDLENYESVARVFQTAHNEHGKIDVVISYLPKAAAVPKFELLTELNPDIVIPYWISRLSFFFFNKREKAFKDNNAKLFFIGPALPTNETILTPVAAAQANGLLGLFRSLISHASVAGCVVALIGISPGESIGEATQSIVDIVQDLEYKKVSTVLEHADTNGHIYILEKGKFKIVPVLDGQLTGTEGSRILVWRYISVLLIVTTIKRWRKNMNENRLRNSIVLLGSILGLVFYAFRSKTIVGWIALLLVAIASRKFLVSAKNDDSLKKGIKIVRSEKETAKVGVFLGSGGHTGEAIQLLSALDPKRYNHRTYIHCTGDTMSVDKALAHERLVYDRHIRENEQSSTATSTITKPYTFIELPRARKVAQPLLSSAFTTLYSLSFAVWHLTIMPMVRRKPLVDLLLVNGPGTCVVVVFAFLLPRLVGLHSPRIIYVESFARVTSLSLSGKVLRPFVDRFVVQWEPEQAKDSDGKGEKTKLGEYHGWLV